MPEKSFAILLLLLAALTGAGQKNDVLLLKKGNRSIDRFFTGQNIAFLTRDRMPVNGAIDSLRRDSIFLTYYQVRTIPTYSGGMITDTSGHYNLAFSVADIGFLPIKKRQPQLFWGRLLLLGGGGFSLVNVVNTIREKDPVFGKDNLPNLLGGIGATAAGMVLLQLTKDYYPIGKQYSLSAL